MNWPELSEIERLGIVEAREYLDSCVNSDAADPETQQTILLGIGYALVAIAAGQRLDREI